MARNVKRCGDFSLSCHLHYAFPYFLHKRCYHVMTHFTPYSTCKVLPLYTTFLHLPLACNIATCCLLSCPSHNLVSLHATCSPATHTWSCHSTPYFFTFPSHNVLALYGTTLRLSSHNVMPCFATFLRLSLIQGVATLCHISSPVPHTMHCHFMPHFFSCPSYTVLPVYGTFLHMSLIPGIATLCTVFSHFPHTRLCQFMPYFFSCPSYKILPMHGTFLRMSLIQGIATLCTISTNIPQHGIATLCTILSHISYKVLPLYATFLHMSLIQVIATLRHISSRVHNIRYCQLKQHFFTCPT